MDRKFAVGLLGIASMVVLALLGIRTTAGTRSPQWQSRSLITERVDDSRRVTLRGNTRPEAIARNDRGLVWPGFRLEHMLLQLKRPAESEQSLDEYIEGLTDKTSPDYHKWLSAVQLGNQYGVSDKDIDFITGWLESHGYHGQLRLSKPHGDGYFGNRVANCGEALHVEIHFLEVDGEMHYRQRERSADSRSARTGVAGIVSMHDFKPHTMLKPRTQYTFASANCGTCFAVTPADLATIYNLNPLFSQGPLGTRPDDRSHRRHQCIRDRRLDHLPYHIRTFGLHFGKFHASPSEFSRITAPIPE